MQSVNAENVIVTLLFAYDDYPAGSAARDRLVADYITSMAELLNITASRYVHTDWPHAGATTWASPAHTHAWPCVAALLCALCREAASLSTLS